MTTPKSALLGWLASYAAGLRFPVLLAIVGGLFLLDLFVPDLIPFADEVLLGLVTVLLASLRKRKGEDTKTIDVKPVPTKE
jgi:hypothetical protein